MVNLSMDYLFNTEGQVVQYFENDWPISNRIRLFTERHPTLPESELLMYKSLQDGAVHAPIVIPSILTQLSCLNNLPGCQLSRTCRAVERSGWA